jgi:hypothetical protein
MAESKLEKIDRLLEGAIENAERSEVRYDLRSARQLIAAVQHEKVEIEDVSPDKPIIEENEFENSLD